MKNREIIPAVVAILLIVGGLALFYYQSAIFLPVLIALLLAYLFNPLVTKLESRGIGRALSILLVFCATLALLSSLSHSSPSP
jgi:predicted PurR-regulated permease PerM